jgi:hypothetical protein
VLIPTPFRKKNVQYVKNCTLLPRLFRGDFYERQPELKRFSHLHNTEKKRFSVAHLSHTFEHKWKGNGMGGRGGKGNARSGLGFTHITTAS